MYIFPSLVIQGVSLIVMIFITFFSTFKDVFLTKLKVETYKHKLVKTIYVHTNTF